LPTFETNKGEAPYQAIEEGEILLSLVATVDKEIDRSRVKFLQGDACNLPSLESLGGSFDIILMANLICRLHTPRLCLEKLRDYVQVGGLIVMFTPCSWLPEFTDKPNWLGGFYEQATGKEVRTLDTLREILSEHFELLETKDQPFLIREHRRKYQLGVALASIWKRKV